jgi:hypothetical protein
MRMVLFTLCFSFGVWLLQQHCIDGQSWQWDGVQFEMLHPDAASFAGVTDLIRGSLDIFSLLTGCMNTERLCTISAASQNNVLNTEGEYP